ncbi:hypothetical protein LTR28_000666, partial [Elasticomyces elasticus]
AAVLEGYAGSVETVGQDEVRSTVVQVVDEMKGEEGSKVHMGDVLKRLLAPDGPFEGKPVEKAEVAKAVKEVLAA